MYWQHEYLRESVTATLGQTYKVDLPTSGMLSAILLKLSASATSGLGLSGGSWRLLDFVGTIEVIANGSTVIKSYTAKQAHFLAWLHQGITPPRKWRNYATNTQFEFIPILFGRTIKDPNYGLDLSKYNNVELRITNSSSATYHGSDISASALCVYGRDMPAGFQGHIRSELWREWTTVADETKYAELPSEFPICTVALRALPSTTNGLSDTGFANLMDDIDLAIGGGQKRVFKGGLDDLVYSNYLDRGAEVLVSGLADVTADKGIDVSIGNMFGWAGISGSKDGAVSATIPTMLADATDNTISFEAREADSPVEFIATGMGYMNMAFLHFNPTLDPALNIDVNRDGKTTLNIHTRNAAASASGTNDIILERVVTG